MVDPTLAEMGKNLNEAMKMLEDNQRYVQRMTTKTIAVCAKGRIINVAAIKQETTNFPSSLRSYCHSDTYTRTNHHCFSDDGIFKINVRIFIHVLYYSEQVQRVCFFQRC